MHPFEPVTILIVEDDALLGRVLARVLTREGRMALLVRDTDHQLTAYADLCSHSRGNQ